VSSKLSHGLPDNYNSYEIDDFRSWIAGYWHLRRLRRYEDMGTELEATWRPSRWFDVHGSWTWQDPRFTSFVFTNSAGC